MKGTHGTCVSAADSIVATGFTSGPGRGGHGVYFWGYVSDDYKNHATNLAIDWWCMRSTQRKFIASPNPACSVLQVTLSSGADSVLDLANQENREKFLQYALTLSLKLGKSKARRPLDNVTVVYDAFLRMMEAQRGAYYKVVGIFLPPPAQSKVKWRNITEEERNLVGDPLCYIVRDSAIIEIEDRRDFSAVDLQRRATT